MPCQLVRLDPAGLSPQPTCDRRTRPQLRFAMSYCLHTAFVWLRERHGQSMTEPPTDVITKWWLFRLTHWSRDEIPRSWYLRMTFFSVALHNTIFHNRSLEHR